MIKEIEERKATLRREIREIEGRFEERSRRLEGIARWIPSGGIKEGVSSFMSGASIHSIPWRAVGVALVVVYASGWLRGGRVAATGLKGILRSSLSSILFAELRRYATKRAMSYVAEQVSERLGHRDESRQK